MTETILGSSNWSKPSTRIKTLVILNIERKFIRYFKI